MGRDSVCHAEPRRRHRCQTRPVPSGSAWQEEKLSAATLPGTRLARRLPRFWIRYRPQAASIPAASGDKAATKVAYPFFHNPRVTDP
ncbi:transposase DNA-binding-containing protein [Mesorhizobium sp.]|uniref:transposase DNA-binding-containing protein n=1 Tax=Mesorhizobium sp. TaxID=1871066 RepID=UPI000FE4C6D2|nr:MAG: hypothetical protein EOS86_31840 [Mesorhizobium sp.]